MLSVTWGLFISTCLYLTANCNTEMDWIDPFKLESSQSKQLDYVTVTSDSDVFAYYRRTVNLILSSVIVESSDPNTYKGRLFVDIPIQDYEFLKKFATIKLEEPLSLQKVDQILTKVFTKSTVDELSDVLIYWSDYIYLAFFNRATGIYLMILAVLIIIYKLLKASYTPPQVIAYLLFLGYMMDFAFTWKRMLRWKLINMQILLSIMNCQQTADYRIHLGGNFFYHSLVALQIAENIIK
ncbi:hypothetical protein AMK59_7618 [Oryctes borbonicus]|uniref:Uncharacterized protein n=1 Tax=Oryctes borbonicus TaxID=1629725 RepID=A0A0T6AX42_9SCAR|nr:hypothetical protein AMK59_7618 [Oryctes borbonicus]